MMRQIHALFAAQSSSISLLVSRGQYRGPIFVGANGLPKKFGARVWGIA